MFTDVKEHQTTFQKEVARVRKKEKKKNPLIFLVIPAVENLDMP